MKEQVRLIKEKHIVQKSVDEFCSFIIDTKFVLNKDKCEAMVFNFSKTLSFAPDIKVGGSEIIKEVSHTNLLGLIIQSDLKWNQNTEYIYGKASS